MFSRIDTSAVSAWRGPSRSAPGVHDRRQVEEDELQPLFGHARLPAQA